MITFARLTHITDSSLRDIRRLLPQLTPDNPLPAKRQLQAVVKENCLIVVRDKGRIVGMGLLVSFVKTTGTRGQIEDVVIDEKYRGKGLGEKLVQRLIKEARRQKLSKVGLTSRPSRIAANKLYRKLGFTPKKTNVYSLLLKRTR
jgi:ribosomal protein S18 acetylase RimI-like enzyme